ncbi:hypothetical protein DERF_007275 [Dermatophagoides farinae]|uniref:Uncharacterized protein n=1 Tax=Dermatophagoides farinae TaxID=6954 RepID=A0A922I059_DERFA|nr:hypothetical protein DERF_007275 [Dermatophagoides farinae]
MIFDISKRIVVNNDPVDEFSPLIGLLCVKSFHENNFFSYTNKDNKCRCNNIQLVLFLHQIPPIVMD